MGSFYLVNSGRFYFLGIYLYPFILYCHTFRTPDGCNVKLWLKAKRRKSYDIDVDVTKPTKEDQSRDNPNKAIFWIFVGFIILVNMTGYVYVPPGLLM